VARVHINRARANRGVTAQRSWRNNRRAFQRENALDLAPTNRERSLLFCDLNLAIESSRPIAKLRRVHLQGERPAPPSCLLARAQTEVNGPAFALYVRQ
jgi:hypothetical protein